MPTYPYACTACDHTFEVVQSFTDDALTECPKCSGRLRKVFGSVGVVFKGSGFYRTDSRSASSSSTPAAHSTTSPSSDGGSSSSKNGAAKAPATSGASSSSSTTSSSSSAA
jgi:putative FmdB family regulatory protein